MGLSDSEALKLMGRRSLFILITSLAFLAIAGAVVVGQVGGADSCPDLVTRALAAVNNLCTGQGRNSACYGNTLVQAQLADGQSDVAFTREGDIANLGLLRSISTSPLNDELTEWGVSVLSVQANLPGALPGQNALFMLIGGTEVESAVTPEDAFMPAASIQVAAAFASPVVSAPTQTAAAVFSVDAGQTMLADAQSGDGAFVRVTLRDQFGWIALAALQTDAAIDALPAYTPGESFTPMQAFYLRTGIGGANCTVAPSALIVQGPENYNVQISANGANISLGSSVILETLPVDGAGSGGGYSGQSGVGGLLRITVIDGHVTITNADGTVTEIPEGYQSTICLTGPQNLGSDGQPNDQTVTYLCGGWTEPEQIPEEFRQQFSLVDDFPLNYGLDILTPVPTFVPTAPPPVLPAVTPVPPTAAPTETPWPIIPTDTPLPPPTPTVGLEFEAEAILTFTGGLGFIPRFMGLGGPGEMWTFDLTLSVHNAGQNTASNIVISNLWPDGVEGFGEPDMGMVDQETGAWVIDALAPGQTATYYGNAFVMLDCGGSISGILNISADTPEAFPAVFSYSANAVCSADLQVDANVSLEQDYYDESRWHLYLSLYVTNYGALPATNLVMGNILPPDVEDVMAETQGFDAQSNSWSIGTLDTYGEAYLMVGGSFTLDCDEGVGSDLTASSDTPLAYAGPWSYFATAICGPQFTPQAMPQADIEVTPEAASAPLPEVTPEATVESKPEATPEVTPEATPEVRQSSSKT